MARNVDQTLWEAWQRRISKQRQSGLSIAEFCRKEGISQGSFHAWKRKLERRDWAAPSPPGSTAPKGQQFGADEGPAGKPDAPAAAGFVQVPLVVAGSREWVELVLGDGTLVRVPAHQTTALTTILRALRSEPPARRPTAEEVRHA
jgi:hypothetical protein